MIPVLEICLSEYLLYNNKLNEILNGVLIMKIRKRLLGIILLLFFILSCASSQKEIRQPQQNLDSRLDDLVNQIVLSLSQNQKSKIAIIEFSDIQGNVTNLGRYLAEELITRLYRTGKFEVVERQLLNKIIKEHKLSLSGMIDQTSAVELGKILGVNAIASGSITDLGGTVKVNARLISTESGKIFSVASIKIPKDETIRNLLGQITKSPTPNKPQVQTNQIIEKEGLKFELVEAQMSGRTVICKIKITNSTEDDKNAEVTYGWHYQTKIYDESGNEYIISAVKFANQLRKITGISQYDGATKKIVAGNSVNMELHFENVSSSATKISLLQILCGYRGFKIEFRNIPIIK